MALLLTALVLGVLVVHLRSLTEEVHAAHRQTDYWRDQAFQAWDWADAENTHVAEQPDQDYWTDNYRVAADGKRNPKAQGWRLWHGRSRNQQTSEVPYPLLQESAARRRPSDRRSWARR